MSNRPREELFLHNYLLTLTRWKSSRCLLFYRKEMTQLLPLITSTVMMGLILQWLVRLNEVHSTWYSSLWIHQSILILSPALFAIGSGALVVSQEKEDRTILWLTSIPVSVSQIVRTKLTCTLIGLILCWIASLVSYMFVVRADSFDADHTALFQNVIGLLCHFVANSLFLLIASFVSAWVLPKGWLALIVLIPAAAVPILVASILIDWIAPNSETLAAVLIAFVYAISTGLVAAIGLRWGSRSIVTRPSIWIQKNTAIVQGLSEKAFSTGRWRRYPPLPALIWQITMQNRVIWGLVSLASLAFVFLFHWNSDKTTLNLSSLLPAMALAGIILLSLLGASTFSSDRENQRVHFLSDRGVPPGAIWWTRQFIPFSILATIFLTYSILYLRLNENAQHHSDVLKPSIPLVLWFLCTIYASTQWTSMWFRTAWMHYIIAPVIAITFLSGTLCALLYFGASYSIIFLSLLLMMIASRVMTRDWIEGRIDLTTKFKHFLFLIGILLCWLLPFAWAILTRPSITKETANLLTQIYEQYDRNANNLIWSDEHRLLHLLDSAPRIDSSQPTTLLQTAIDETLDDDLARLSIGQFSSITHAMLEYYLGEFQRTKFRVLQNSDDVAQWQHFRKLILLLARVAKSFRMHSTLELQELADNIEQRIIQELRDPSTRSRFERSELLSILEPLANRADRNRARVRSLAFTLHRPSLDTSPFDRNLLGHWSGNSYLFAEGWIQEREFKRSIEILYLFATSKSRDDNNEFYRAYQVRFPSADSYLLTHGAGRRPQSPVGYSWHGQWEFEAEELFKIVKDQRP